MKKLLRMILREWYAGIALRELIRVSPDRFFKDSQEVEALLAYSYADAMLEERVRSDAT